MSQFLHDGWRGRVAEERRQLAERLERLILFLVSSGSAGSPARHLDLLARQRDAMTRYLAVLDERLALP